MREDTDYSVLCGVLRGSAYWIRNWQKEKKRLKETISKGTSFEDRPDDWDGPVCGAIEPSLRPLAGLGSVEQSGS